MLLKVSKLNKMFNNKKVIDDVSFNVSVGECLGIVGKSGSGKSTIAKIITRLLDADSGKIYFNGEDITNLSGSKLVKVYENIKMIFQSPINSFNPRKTLGFSIQEGFRNQKLPKTETVSRMNALLRSVGLTEKFSKRYPHEVSGGECQRAAIARALMVKPKLLISDEATSALDENIETDIVNLIKNICEKENIACLFITHNLGLLPKIANRVLVMEDGKIVETGSPYEILNDPNSNAAKELVEAYNFFR